jgi:hypothetical protein
MHHEVCKLYHVFTWWRRRRPRHFLQMGSQNGQATDSYIKLFCNACKLNSNPVSNTDWIILLSVTWRRVVLFKYLGVSSEHTVFLIRIEAYAKQVASVSKALYFFANCLVYLSVLRRRQYVPPKRCWLSGYTASHPRIRTLHNGNLKSIRDVDCWERGWRTLS